MDTKRVGLITTSISILFSFHCGKSIAFFGIRIIATLIICYLLFSRIVWTTVAARGGVSISLPISLPALGPELKNPDRVQNRARRSKAPHLQRAANVAKATWIATGLVCRFPHHNRAKPPSRSATVLRNGSHPESHRANIYETIMP